MFPSFCRFVYNVMSGSKYSKILAKLPRVSLDNLKPNPYAVKLRSVQRGDRAIRRPSQGPTNIKPRIGFSHATPFQKRIPKYGFNRESHLKRQYFPLTLWQLQRLIDLGRIDPTEPIDLNAICNSRVFKMVPCESTYFGVYLLSQGANIFQAKVNIEAQIVDELAIASVEKNGGVVSTAFYDRMSFEALCNPVDYFLRGKPIEKRLLPPEELVPYYTDPRMRGYLSDPAEIQKEKASLADLYGYELPDLSKDKDFEMLTMRKDPRQIFFGLSPGWLVNLADETVIKPEEEYLKKYSVV